MKALRYFLGLDYAALQGKKAKPVIYDPSQLINGHMLISGMSGTGKSFVSKRLLSAASQAGIAIDIFDVHEELDGIPGSKAVKYSPATQFGYNPLVVNPDEHDGGPGRQADYFVGLVKSVSPSFGINQETVLRHLINDLYRASQVYQDNPKTWGKREISADEHKALIDARRYSELREFYPTMADLMSYAARKVAMLKLGADSAAATAFEQLSKAQKSLNRAKASLRKQADPDEIDRLEVRVEDLANKTIEAYTAFVRATENGREFEEFLKYDSADTLAGVIRRIEMLNNAGIFSANAPPFGQAGVRVHQIKSLTDEQQVLFTRLRLRALFEHYKAMGPTKTGTEIRHIIFLDEAHRFFGDGASEISTIARESRKFGLCLWAASQDPTAFPRDFLTNCGATVLLGVHSMFWGSMLKMFRITEPVLRSIKPKEVLGIRLQRQGEGDPEFVTVAVPNPGTQTGTLVSNWFVSASKGGGSRAQAEKVNG